MKVSHICKSYGSLDVFEDFSAEFADGTVNCIMGPSGCGKTTLLDIVAGLENPSCGSVEGVGRSIACAFQEPRLLPWLSVAQNVDFVLPRAMTAAERAAVVDKWLGVMHLQDFASALPPQLSGGMAQRVSLARALAVDADLLLLDEPFKGIDTDLRYELMLFLRRHWAARGTTVLMVTHDEREAEALGATLHRLG